MYQQCTNAYDRARDWNLYGKVSIKTDRLRALASPRS